MHLRLWAIGAGLLAVLAVPATAQASVGVGIQAGPVRLAGSAHPGGSYALPDVLVVNTGTGPESVSLSIDRVSDGSGRTVPPSWVHAGGAVTLDARQSARVPLQLAVPENARPGRYFSDVLVKAGAPNSASGASFDAGAATQLAFTVVPGPVSAPWFSVPIWVLPGIGVVLLIGASACLMRRLGLRVQVDREPAGARSQALRRRGLARLAVPVVLIALAGCGTAAAPQGSSNGATIKLTLHTVSDVRSAVVSPSSGTFTNCYGGSARDHTPSTSKLLGFPNGRCSFYPISITNDGIPAHIEVFASNASASDGDGLWTLCNAGEHPAVTCTDVSKKPGLNQFLLANSNRTGTTYSAGLTGNLSCDHVFNQSHGCWAGHGAQQLESIKITGPSQTTDTSTTWTMTVTWFAVPGKS
ncbi:MAG TPA: hypothetical protein VMA72_23370 [Streptosporangiaceae bacterium]|nr:hypothetical protein [Streptosporangiaceae bacterium]